MSIPYLTAHIIANIPDRTIPEPSTRAELIASLPSFLEVVLTTPNGLTMINIGKDIPEDIHRNKPWFCTNQPDHAEYPRGIYLWNYESKEWDNITPDSVFDIMRKAEEALETAKNAKSKSEDALAEADRAKAFATDIEEYAEESKGAAEAANDAIQLANNQATTYYGHIDSGTIMQIPNNIGAFASTWVKLVGVPKLKTEPKPVAFMTIKGIDSTPAAYEKPFTYGIDIRVNGNDVEARVVGYVLAASEVQRTVKFMWMVKGAPADD